MSDDDGRSPSSGSEETDADGSDGSDGVDGTGTAGPRVPERGEFDDRRNRVGSRGDGPRDLLNRVLSANSGPMMVVREVAVSVVTVALIGVLLFALSGVWPPMVAVESGSMEPHMHRGDLVFVSEPGRYVPDGAGHDRGVVTRAEGKRIDYRSFGGYGSVIVYDSPGRGGPPVIHRAHFWVTDGENWYDEANPAYHNADDCDELRNCPAPHAGFITKGDANGGYDQVLGISSPVRSDWVVGIAQIRVPYLGYVRLWLAEESGAALAAGRNDAAPTGVVGSVETSARNGAGTARDTNRSVRATRIENPNDNRKPKRHEPKRRDGSTPRMTVADAGNREYCRPRCPV